MFMSNPFKLKRGRSKRGFSSIWREREHIAEAANFCSIKIVYPFFGKLACVAWIALFIHCIIHEIFGVPFTAVTDHMGPYVSAWPIFDRLNEYYAYDLEKLNEAKSFYIFNYAVYFSVSAIVIFGAFLEAWQLCRSSTYIQFIPHCTRQNYIGYSW